MKSRYLPLLVISLAMLASPSITQAETLTTDQLQATTIELSETGSSISRTGGRPVLIDDRLKVVKRLDLRGPLVNKKGYIVINDTVVPKKDIHTLGTADLFWAALYARNIILPDGGKVDGVDVSALSQKVDTIESAVDGFTDTNTTYTAGSGLTLTDTTFSLTGVGNILTVAPNGGAQYSTIADAVAAINAADDASYSNQYLIYLAPGEYTENVNLPDYTSIRGATRDSTYIYTFSTNETQGAINSGRYSTISDLTIYVESPTTAIGILADTADTTVDNVSISISFENPATAYGIYSIGENPLGLNEVHITVQDATTAAYGVYADYKLDIQDSYIQAESNDGATTYGIYSTSDGAGLPSTIRDTEVYANNAGTGTCAAFASVNLSSSTLYFDINNSRLYAYNCDTNIGVHVPQYGSITVSDSQLIGDNDLGILTESASDNAIIRVKTSEVNHGVTVGAATNIDCIFTYGSYSGNLGELDSSCTPIP